MPLITGQILNSRYRIVKLLGQGGFGAVYRAWDINLSKPCALKENLDTSPEAQRQFAREASILANLRQPNLPVVGDHFSLPGQGQYLVMDYVEGEDLQLMLDRTGGPLDEAQVLRWITQVSDALTYLHNHQPPVIHRDIKPANIKITPQGQAILVDFGVAKVYDPKLKTTLGARAVTPGYSPPEQYGQGTTDARSDIYALGATLYSLLTGQAPADSVDILTRRAPAPAPVSTLNPQVSSQVSAAIAKAMQPESSQRFNSAAEFAAALTLPTIHIETTPSSDKTVLTAQAASPAPVSAPIMQPAHVSGPPSSPPVAVRVPNQPRRKRVKPLLPSKQNWLIWAGLAAGGLLVLVAFVWIFANPGRKPSGTSPLPVTQMPFSSTLYFTSSQSGKPEIFYYSDQLAQSIQLTHTPDNAKSWGPAISKDGTLYFTSDQSGNPEIYYYSDQEAKPIQLTHTSNGESSEPAIAPDGTLYFTSNQSGKREIYYYSDQEAKPIQLTHTDGNGESWKPAIAPDGTLYFSSSQSGKPEIYYYSDQQARPIQLTHTAGKEGSWEPAIAPDGTLYFTSDQSGKPEIYYYSDQQARPIQLTHTSNGESTEPAVAPDGTLYFTSTQSGKREIYYYSDQEARSIQLTHTDGNGESWEPAF
jgi:serine/threonine protein kinase